MKLKVKRKEPFIIVYNSLKPAGAIELELELEGMEITDCPPVWDR